MKKNIFFHEKKYFFREDNLLTAIGKGVSDVLSVVYIVLQG